MILLKKKWRPLGVSNPCCRDENPEKGPQEKDQQGNHYQLSHNSSPELEFFPNWLLSMGLATVIIGEDGTIKPTGRVIEVARPD